MKKLFILIFGLIFCFLLTTGVSAEETRATDVIVDTNNNTLLFIYDNQVLKLLTMMKQIIHMDITTTNTTQIFNMV